VLMKTADLDEDGWSELMILDTQSFLTLYDAVDGGSYEAVQAVALATNSVSDLGAGHVSGPEAADLVLAHSAGLVLLVEAPIRDAVIYYRGRERAHGSAAFWLLLTFASIALVAVALLWKQLKLLAFDAEFGATLGVPMRAVEVALGPGLGQRHAVLLGHLVAGVGHRLDEPAVVGQQKEALGVLVEAANPRVAEEPLGAQDAPDGVRRMGIVVAAQHPRGLVEAVDAGRGGLE